MSIPERYSLRSPLVYCTLCIWYGFPPVCTWKMAGEGYEYCLWHTLQWYRFSLQSCKKGDRGAEGCIGCFNNHYGHHIHPQMSSLRFTGPSLFYTVLTNKNIIKKYATLFPLHLLCCVLVALLDEITYPGRWSVIYCLPFFMSSNLWWCCVFLLISQPTGYTKHVESVWM